MDSNFVQTPPPLQNGQSPLFWIFFYFDVAPNNIGVLSVFREFYLILLVFDEL